MMIHHFNAWTCGFRMHEKDIPKPCYFHFYNFRKTVLGVLGAAIQNVCDNGIKIILPVTNWSSNMRKHYTSQMLLKAKL